MCPNETSVVGEMCPLKTGLCGDKVGARAAISDAVGTEVIVDQVDVGAIACGREFPCPVDDISHRWHASQQRIFGCSAAQPVSVSCCFVLFHLLFFSYLLGVYGTPYILSNFRRIEMLKE